MNMLIEDYNIASWIISKTLALSYFVAFLSLLPQVLGLYGSQGILSIDHLLNLLDKELKAERFYHVPSLFWFSSGDLTLKLFCFIGMTASSLAFLGFSQSFMFLTCFICYLSFVSCGQIFLSYQWDSLLLELGFLGLFFAPWQWEWIPLAAHNLHPIMLGLVIFLLFKLMFLSGIVKLTHKDGSWKDLTALTYHYWTQPLPTPVAYFAHKMPRWFQKMSTVIMFFIELVCPFLMLVPGKTQVVAVALLLTLQFLIILTGNYGFFNLLTIGLCLAVLPDAAWGFKINWVEATTLPTAVMLVPALILVPSSLFWILKTLSENSTKLNFMLPYMRFFYPFRINNPYGLFAVMTKTRPEVVLQGSNDGLNWEDYEFQFKPGSLKKAPPVCAPHQPRMDWQMWFAALENFNENMWLQNLATRVFEQSPDVMTLFSKDPFKGTSPRFLRFERYEYRFSDFKDLRQNGQWWERVHSGSYGPVFGRDDGNGEPA
ncbi:lipase maturation factor family protein [Bdellovibrio bacteriovorus]|uniref:lipase maturation factor family protein n=1 Tax=Bdellovibrio bacteriovorus TaxID=959 RepID=UPI0035A5F8C8